MENYNYDNYLMDDDLDMMMHNQGYQEYTGDAE